MFAHRRAGRAPVLAHPQASLKWNVSKRRLAGRIHAPADPLLARLVDRRHAALFVVLCGLVVASSGKRRKSRYNKGEGVGEGSPEAAGGQGWWGGGG